MQARPSLFQLSKEEPFRLFFPLGLLIGIIGIALWPLFQLHLLPIYPAIMHARLMVEGFTGAFILGFLGTAGPRMLSAPHLTGKEVACFVGLEVLLTGLHLASLTLWGDVVFLCLLLLFVGSFALRFRKREHLPPPNFVLVLFGMLSGIAGVVLLLIRIPSCYSMGYLLLYQGFILFPVLGVGIFLFPRFLGLKILPGFPGVRVPDWCWGQQALRTAALGLLIIGTFFMESMGAPQVGMAIRLIAAFSLLPRGIFFQRSTPGTLAKDLSLSVGLMLLGLLLMCLLPTYRVASFHILAIGGFGLMVFLVATRVMFGHSGIGHTLKGRSPFLIATVTLMLVGMVLRFCADFHILTRIHWISGGALFWILGAIVWGIRTVPRIFVPDTDD